MKRCELLIPAGGKKQYIAAVENGADAVYVGGKHFNARMNAENFSDDELEKAVDYAHVRNVKTYIAMNTLLDDDQLIPALRQAEIYSKIGVDGVIIQDLGLGLLIKERLPYLPLHLSTQAGIYDAEGVRAAARLGYERVVLARELSFEEIRKAADVGIETEVFVHGALCMCYSGQCQLSRVIGGRSGNKGSCAQPCRLPYKGAKEPYPLSPKDLCLLEEVGRLAQAGIASLKVEGRMKSPEYVAVVTSIYRKYLDRWYQFGSYEVEEEDLAALKQIFNRGGFTKGYFYNDPGKELMASDLSKNAGIFSGVVEKDSAGPLILVRQPSGEGCSSDYAKISKGDYIEIRGRKNSGNLITYAEKKRGGLIEIGDIKVKSYRGDRVYRLTSGLLMERARKTFEGIDFEGGKYLRKVPVAFRITAEAGGKLKAEAYCSAWSVKKYGVALEKAENNDGLTANVKKQFSKTGGTPFAVSEITVIEKEPCYAPVSDINALRRETLHELEKKIKESYKRKSGEDDTVSGEDFNHTGPVKPVAGAGIEASAENVREAYQRTFEVVFFGADDFMSINLEGLLKKIRQSAGMERKIRMLVPIGAYELCRNKEEAGFEVVPYIMAMNKGAGDEWIEENFDRLSSLLKEDNKPIYVGNIRWIKEFSAAGVEVLGDSGINATNCYARKACTLLGASACVFSLEKEEAGFGAFPLMISEHRFETERIVDRKGEAYNLEFDASNHKTLLIREDAPLDWMKIGKASSGKSEVVRLYIGKKI